MDRNEALRLLKDPNARQALQQALNEEGASTFNVDLNDIQDLDEMKRVFRDFMKFNDDRFSSVTRQVEETVSTKSKEERDAQLRREAEKLASSDPTFKAAYEKGEHPELFKDLNGFLSIGHDLNTAWKKALRANEMKSEETGKSKPADTDEKSTDDSSTPPPSISTESSVDPKTETRLETKVESVNDAISQAIDEAIQEHGDGFIARTL